MKRKRISSAREAFQWTYLVCFAAIVLVVLFMMAVGTATLTEASGLLMTLMGGGAAQATAFTWGRTQEKKAGVADAPPAEVVAG